jgi:ATP-dependent Clp protease ATP-binding subunit ClpC
MFERYTEDARRAVFFARYEAAQVGNPYITPDHLLLGIIRENNALKQLFKLEESADAIRASLANSSSERFSASVDLPLSDDSKRILAYAAEEAEMLGHKWIGSEHLLLGILREKSSTTDHLLASGLTLDEAREKIRSNVPERAPMRGSKYSFVTQEGRSVVIPPLSFVQRYAVVLIVLAFAIGVVIGLAAR